VDIRKELFIIEKTVKRQWVLRQLKKCLSARLRQEFDNTFCTELATTMREGDRGMLPAIAPFNQQSSTSIFFKVICLS
jgi:hypothetical protein